MKSILDSLKRPLLASGFAWILYGACSELYQIAWGTGKWIGEFSRTWALLFYAFVFFCVILFTFFCFFIWKREIFERYIDRFIDLRRKIGVFRWLLWLVVFIAPVWLFQFTAWGIVLQKFYLRVFIWMIVVCVLAILASNDKHLAGWRQILSMFILTASLFSIADTLNLVNAYPFSQGWSEGNRLWDYSVLFGRDRYTTNPPEKTFRFILILSANL